MAEAIPVISVLAPAELSADKLTKEMSKKERKASVAIQHITDKASEPAAADLKAKKVSRLQAIKASLSTAIFGSFKSQKAFKAEFEAAYKPKEKATREERVATLAAGLDFLKKKGTDELGARLSVRPEYAKEIGDRLTSILDRLQSENKGEQAHAIAEGERLLENLKGRVSTKLRVEKIKVVAKVALLALVTIAGLFAGGVVAAAVANPVGIGLLATIALCGIGYTIYKRKLAEKNVFALKEQIKLPKPNEQKLEELKKLKSASIDYEKCLNKLRQAHPGYEEKMPPEDQKKIKDLAAAKQFDKAIEHFETAVKAVIQSVEDRRKAAQLREVNKEFLEQAKTEKSAKQYKKALASLRKAYPDYEKRFTPDDRAEIRNLSQSKNYKDAVKQFEGCVKALIEKNEKGRKEAALQPINQDLVNEAQKMKTADFKAIFNVLREAYPGYEDKFPEGLKIAIKKFEKNGQFKEAAERFEKGVELITDPFKRYKFEEQGIQILSKIVQGPQKEGQAPPQVALNDKEKADLQLFLEYAVKNRELNEGLRVLKIKSPAERFIETYSYKSQFFQSSDKGSEKAGAILSTTSMDPLYWISVDTADELMEKRIKDSVDGLQKSVEQIMEHISGNTKLEKEAEALGKAANRLKEFSYMNPYREDLTSWIEAVEKDLSPLLKKGFLEKDAFVSKELEKIKESLKLAKEAAKLVNENNRITADVIQATKQFDREKGEFIPHPDNEKNPLLQTAHTAMEKLKKDAYFKKADASEKTRILKAVQGTMSDLIGKIGTDEFPTDKEEREEFIKKSLLEDLQSVAVTDSLKGITAQAEFQNLSPEGLAQLNSVVVQVMSEIIGNDKFTTKMSEAQKKKFIRDTVARIVKPYKLSKEADSKLKKEVIAAVDELVKNEKLFEFTQAKKEAEIQTGFVAVEALLANKEFLQFSENGKKNFVYAAFSFMEQMITKKKTERLTLRELYAMETVEKMREGFPGGHGIAALEELERRFEPAREALQKLDTLGQTSAQSQSGDIVFHTDDYEHLFLGKKKLSAKGAFKKHFKIIADGLWNMRQKGFFPIQAWFSGNLTHAGMTNVQKNKVMVSEMSNVDYNNEEALFSHECISITYSPDFSKIITGDGLAQLKGLYPESTEDRVIFDDVKKLYQKKVSEILDKHKDEYAKIKFDSWKALGLTRANFLAAFKPKTRRGLAQEVRALCEQSMFCSELATRIMVKTLADLRIELSLKLGKKEGDELPIFKDIIPPTVRFEKVGPKELAKYIEAGQCFQLTPASRIIDFIVDRQAA